jgi:hypothetical protein
VSDPSRDLVDRIDSTAKRVVKRIHLPVPPTRLTADDRDVWVLSRSPARALWRIDARTNRVEARIPLPIIPRRVALGADSVWVTGYRWSNGVDASRGGMVLRIDPATDDIVARFPLGDLASDGVLVSHGLVWVAVAPSA